MNASIALPALLCAVALVTGCGSKPEPTSCSNANAFADREADALAAATSDYAPPVITDCPELDPPLDGQDASEGLTASEYGAILRGANGNFFDDGTWWLKAIPRGESHVIPVQITAERCGVVSFDKFGYDYAFATPPLSSAPSCGRYLTGVQIGHQLGDSWPRIFSIEGSGAVSLSPLSATAEFGPVLRLPRDPAAAPLQDSTLTQLDVVRHDGDSVELAALVNGPTFVSALRIVFKVGDPSRLSVELELDPRALAVSNPRVAVAALSGWYSSEGKTDVDHVQAMFSDGNSPDIALSDASLNWGDGDWTPVAAAHSNSALESVTFTQSRTSDDGSERPNVTISNLQSSVPIALELDLSSRPIAGANVIANLLLDTSVAQGSDAPISVSYLVTAASP